MTRDRESFEMKVTRPILLSGLFRELHDHLLDLLRSLRPADWRRPTACSEWSVQDIASHLLDGDLRRLSIQRDRHAPPGTPARFESHEDLVAYLHRLNADWTAATRRLSPRVLIRLLEISGEDVADLFEGTDPFRPATFPVAWAGETRSPMWFDVAREYTERWHHQRQIADAVGRPTPIDGPGLYHPALDTFLRALPYIYRDVDAPRGTTVRVRIVGPAGGDWVVCRAAGGWALLDDPRDIADATVWIDQADAWKLFTKRTDRATARARFPGIRIEGDVELGERALELVAIMA